MSEEKNQPSGSNGEGNQSGAADLIRRADEARQGLVQENQRFEKNLTEFREIEARRILGGQSEAGRAPEVKQEISAKDYAKMALSGKLLK